MYEIKRFYFDKPANHVCFVDTIEEAREHCKDPKTHKIDKKGNIIWFDGFDRC